MEGVRRGDDVAFTRGLTIDEELLDELLARATSSAAEGLKKADFTGARFTDIARFDRTRFVGGATFEGSVFEQPLFMLGCRVEGEAYFSRAVFRSNAFFNHVRFERATFELVAFERGADFSGCEFDSISLYGTASHAELSLAGVVVHEDVSIGPLFSTSVVRLDGAKFEGVAIMRVVARELTCVATTFTRGSLIEVRRAMMLLDHAVFREPSTIAASVVSFERSIRDSHEGELFDEEPLERLGLGERPLLVSLNLVDASCLSLSGVDLSDCLFRGARNLDRVHIEGARAFGRTPGGLEVAWSWPPVRWWTRRRVVADERLWRAAMAPPADGAWRESEILGLLSDRSLDFVTEAVASNPDSIADLYRSLRKADEDARNEPAAADFYYGEMEMRRASVDYPRSERALLFLYWLVSGYGLRASRAFVALLLTVLLFAIGFQFWGFAGSATFTEALLYSANSTVSILRAPVRELTTTGGAMDILLRLLGPLFFGLILVSLRGRIKR